MMLNWTPTITNLLPLPLPCELRKHSTQTQLSRLFMLARSHLITQHWSAEKVVVLLSSFWVVGHFERKININLIDFTRLSVNPLTPTFSGCAAVSIHRQYISLCVTNKALCSHLSVSWSKSYSFTSALFTLQLFFSTPPTDCTRL